MKTSNVVKLLIKNGFELEDSEIVHDDLDPDDTSLDLHIDKYAKGNENIELQYDEFELFSVGYMNGNGKPYIVGSEKTLKDILDGNVKFKAMRKARSMRRFCNIKESVDKDTLFAIDGYIEVYEDSYDKGEGNYVQSYDLDIKGKYSFKDLMKQLSYYGYSTDPKDYTFDDVNGYSAIYSSCMQNADGYEPSKSEIERWKKGEITLYTANLFARIYEVGVHDVSYEDAKEIGFSF